MSTNWKREKRWASIVAASRTIEHFDNLYVSLRLIIEPYSRVVSFFQFGQLFFWTRTNFDDDENNHYLQSYQLARAKSNFLLPLIEQFDSITIRKRESWIFSLSLSLSLFT